MFRITEYSYRHAKAVLVHNPEFNEAYQEIRNILENLDPPLLNPSGDPRRGGVKRRDRKPLKSDPEQRRRYILFPVDQKSLNINLDEAFSESNWELQPYIVDPNTNQGPETGIKADYKKERIQVEVQFGNMARWYSDVFKFQLSYSLRRIDVAVLVVPMQRFANLIDENVAHYERVVRELPWAKMSLTLPILVIGIEPENYSQIEQCYNEAAAHLIEQNRLAGRVIAVIPFSRRLEEVQESTDDINR